jgi:hypothetical protein
MMYHLRMPIPPGARPPQKVSCLCGADVRVDLLSGDRKVTCPACSSTFDFVVTMDAARKNSRVSLILPRAALGMPKPPVEAPAPPPPPMPKAVTRVPKTAGKTLRGMVAACECGEHFPLVDDGELSSLQSCPHCRRSYHVAFRIETQTGKKTAMLAPSGGRAKKTIVPPPSAKKTVMATLCPCGGLYGTRTGSPEIVCGWCGQARRQ